jgi:hypothetical protein
MGSDVAMSTTEETLQQLQRQQQQQTQGNGPFEPVKRV